MDLIETLFEDADEDGVKTPPCCMRLSCSIPHISKVALKTPVLAIKEFLLAKPVKSAPTFLEMDVVYFLIFYSKHSPVDRMFLFECQQYYAGLNADTQNEVKFTFINCDEAATIDLQSALNIDFTPMLVGLVNDTVLHPTERTPDFGSTTFTVEIYTYLGAFITQSIKMRTLLRGKRLRAITSAAL